MWLRFVVVVAISLTSGTNAGAALQSSRFPASSFVTGPKGFLSKGLAPSQVLLLRDARGGLPTHKFPHFSLKSDQSITWDATGLCLEANGKNRGDVVRFNGCTGGPAQKWNYLSNRQGGAMIQLTSTSKCLDVAGKEGDVSKQQVVLQECDHAVTESWAFIAPSPLRIRGSSRPSYKRFVTMPYIVTVLLLGLVGFRALVWRWQTRTRTHLPLIHTDAVHTEAACQGSAFYNMDLGGISLSRPSTAPWNQGRDPISQEMVPAAMVLAPAVVQARPKQRTTVAIPRFVRCDEEEDAKINNGSVSVELDMEVERKRVQMMLPQTKFMNSARRLLDAMRFAPDVSTEEEAKTANMSISMAFDLECERRRAQMAELVARTRSMNLVRTLFDAMHSALDVYTDAIEDVPSTLAWSEHFNGGLVPVDPAEDLSLTVKRGHLPKDVCGDYMRIGSNPAIWPPTRRTSEFDGDGMVHSVRIVDGTATYHCQYLETPRHLFEKELGAEWFSRLAELNGKTGLLKAIEGCAKTKIAGIEDWESGIANTAIACTPEGHLWALYETGAPFRFRLNENGKPESLGVDSLQGTNERPMSAHPKIDQRTGEVFFHGHEASSGFFVARAVDGKVQDKVNLDLPPGLHHDMFITENFVVVVHGSTRMNLDGIINEGPLLKFNPEEVLRFGVMRRDAGPMTPESFTWIDTSVPADIIHTLHAYDEDDKIILWAPLTFYSPDKGSAMLADVELFCMHRLVIDTQAKSVKIRKIEGAETKISEFPRIRDDRIGGDTRYGYSALQSPGPGEGFNLTGILKWDFKECRLAGEIKFDTHVVGGEPVFIPKSKMMASAEEAKHDEDDDGYIGMFLWNYEKLESTFVLFDANSFSHEPVVELLIPRRVPLGFHAAWITEKQFQKQLSPSIGLLGLSSKTEQ